MVKRKVLHLDDVLARIENPEDAFTFSRWGDGEWRAVFGQYSGKRNCDRHRYFPSMGKELYNVLADKPEYVMGMQGLALRIFEGRILEQIEMAGIGDIEWVDSDVFHQGSLHGHLHRIVAAVNKRRVIMVGPPPLIAVNNHPTLPLDYWRFVNVPPRDAYLQKDAITDRIKSLLTTYPAEDEPLLISICASMPAEIILHEIYPLTKGRHTAIDFGSLWDPLVGVASRGYHRDKGTDALVNARSFGEHITEAMEEENGS
tara:strand:- start:2537 stop:3310 length:774 start_codon:yes stop_codon:yes gene_type:complete